MGTLTFGYSGEPVPGRLTKRGRPRCRIVINPDEAKNVLLIFEWYVKGDSLNDIARKLNAIPGVPLPRKSNGIGWTHNLVRAVLLRTAYRGLWSFSVTEKTFLPTKDYAQTSLAKNRYGRQLLRIYASSPTPLVPAQTRLAKNRGIRGRRAENENADRSLRILSGLFWCPEHDRPLRACSAFGKYLGCPSCAMLEAETRPLFSKPNRAVVRRLLCEKLAELIRQEPELVHNYCRMPSAGGCDPTN